MTFHAGWISTWRRAEVLFVVAALCATRAAAQPPDVSVTPPPAIEFKFSQESSEPSVTDLELLPPAEPVVRPAPSPPLDLGEVVESVDQHFPLLQAALMERAITAGQVQSAFGAFDTRLSSDGISEAMGFYRNTRSSVLLDQPTYWGGNLLTGYRIGRGDFEPWYLERQTNAGGEFMVGMVYPFLRGREIDKRRAELFKAEVQRAAAEPFIGEKRIAFIQKAATAYWKWVASGQAYRVVRQQLKLAEDRQGGIRLRIEAGDLAPIESVDNERLIAARQAKLYRADRKFQQAAYELSLFVRADDGMPIVVPANRLPQFPEPALPDSEQVAADVEIAFQLRPELRKLALARRKALIDLNFAENLTLPKFDSKFKASQDVGAPTSFKRDKSPFELDAGLYFEVPLQRRRARGEIRTAQAEIQRINAERRYVQDLIVAELQTAMAGLTTSYNELDRARRGVALAAEMQRAEEIRFDAGDSNILIIQLREAATLEERLEAIDALFNYYLAMAHYRAALGVDATPNSPIAAAMTPAP